MKKRPQKSRTNKNIWTAIFVIALLIISVITGMRTNFYGVAIGVLLGFLISALINNLKN